jgi:hypothetical protein
VHCAWEWGENLLGSKKKLLLGGSRRNRKIIFLLDLIYMHNIRFLFNI